MADKPKGFPWLNVEFKHQESRPDRISIRDWLLNVVAPLLALLAVARLLAWLLAWLI